MKRQLTSVALGLAVICGGFAAAAPAFAQTDPQPVVVLRGCVQTEQDGTVSFSVAGAGANPAVGGPLRRGQIARNTGLVAPEPVPPTCGLFIATRNDDGTWTYQVVTATSDDAAGTITLQKQEGSWTSPRAPFGEQ